MEFHMGSCTFCGMCADFCTKNSIELSKEYSMVVRNEDDLKVRGSFVKKTPPKKEFTPEQLAKMKAAKAAKAAKAVEVAEDEERDGCPDA